MKAWTLDSTGGALRLDDVPNPQLRDGGAVLRMLAVQVPAYTRVLTTGGRGGIATPTVLGIGGIGRVEAVADDVHTVRSGDIALCTGFLTTGRVADPEEVLLGWTGIGGRGQRSEATGDGRPNAERSHADSQGASRAASLEASVEGA